MSVKTEESPNVIEDVNVSSYENASFDADEISANNLTTQINNKGIPPSDDHIQNASMNSVSECNNKYASINFAEFEDRDDPFDRAVLNSINDMEELAKVLHSSQIKQEDSLNNSNANVRLGHPYPDHMPLTKPSQSTNTNIYGNVSNCSSSTNVNTFNLPNTTNSIGAKQQHFFDAFGMNTFSSGSSGYAPTNPLNSGVATTVHNGLMPFAATNPFVIQSHMSSNTTKVSNMQNIPPSDQVQPTTQDITLPRPDLEQFYSKYYGNDPLFQQSVPIQESASSSKSVPDLTDLADTEVSMLCLADT